MAGDISRDEMHRLNQYALEDDFLFDAIEGASAFESGNANAINDLASRLPKQNKKRNKLYFWMSAAAGVAIIVFTLTFIQAPDQNAISDVVAMESAPLAEDKEKTGINKGKLTKSDKAPEANIEKSTQGGDNGSRPKFNPSKPSKAAVVDIEKKSTAKEGAAVKPSPLASPNPIAEEKEDASTLAEVIVLDDMVEEEEIPVIAYTPPPPSYSKTEIKEAKLAPAASRRTTGLSRSKHRKRGDANTFKPENKAVSSKKRSEGEENIPSSAAPIADLADQKIAYLFEVVIEEDPINSLNLLEYMHDKLVLDNIKGEFSAQFFVQNGELASEIKVVKSLGKTLDDNVIMLIESFEGWEDSGNKLIRILFN